MLKVSLVLLATLACMPLAAAEPSVAVTASPLHMVVPMAEVTAEVRLAPRVGLAVIGGIGAFHEPTTNARVSLYEGGLSGRYYVTGSFATGIQLGAEAVYVHAATTAMSVDVRAAGFGLAPFAGYKWTHSGGFTFEGQLGATIMVARAKADTGEMAERSAVGPMLNLQVGYSF